jgi:GcrA cell cycle regulator
MANWSDVEVAQARKYFAAGMSCRAIAAEMGRSRSAVVGKLYRVGLAAADRIRKPRAARRLSGFADRILSADQAGAVSSDWQRFKSKPALGYPGKPLLELAANQCHYPIDPAGDDPRVLFCAAPVMHTGASWCAYHFAICYRPAPATVSAFARVGFERENLQRSL